MSTTLLAPAHAMVLEKRIGPLPLLTRHAQLVTFQMITHIFVPHGFAGLLPLNPDIEMLHSKDYFSIPSLVLKKRNKMISAKKLIKLARKWQKLAAIKRKRITLSRTSGEVDTNSCSTSSMVEKGHFVVYSSDENRFVLPLEYLKNEIVMELFQLAEEEFGLQGNEHLTLPCDATLM
ncbi:hypothetical protein V6N13_090120 [Hibiscus sabdariffa]